MSGRQWWCSHARASPHGRPSAPSRSRSTVEYEPFLIQHTASFHQGMAPCGTSELVVYTEHPPGTCFVGDEVLLRASQWDLHRPVSTVAGCDEEAPAAVNSLRKSPIFEVYGFKSPRPTGSAGQRVNEVGGSSYVGTIGPGMFTKRGTVDG